MVVEEITKYDDPIEAAKSIIPLMTSDSINEAMRMYIAYRMTGFSLREALSLVDRRKRILNIWRQNPLFSEWEQAASGELRKEYRKEIIELLFLKNYMLALKYDFDILMKVANPQLDENGFPTNTPSKQEFVYLLKARGTYSPTQLEAIQGMVKSSGVDKTMNITKFLMEMRKGNQKLTVALETDEQDS